MPSFLRALRAAGGKPLRAQIPRRAHRAHLEPLEPRWLLSGPSDPIQPTADEQYMLELVNRARANPAAEGQRLLAMAANDPVIAAAVGQTHWNLAQFSQVIDGFGSLPPLAFNPRLLEAARDENQAMLAQNNQVHSPPGYLYDPTIATASDGQAFYPLGNGAWSVGENVFAYSQIVHGPTVQAYVDYLEAGMLIDWGNPTFDHLENLLAPGPGEAAGASHFPYSEIGIGVLTGAVPTIPPPPNPSNPANAGLNVGPVMVSQEFAYRAGNAFLTGVVYQDSDHNQFYSPGEGLGGVTIRAVGTAGQGVFQTQTWNAGGYSLQLPPGTYDVTATGGALAPKSTVITIGLDNVLWDVVATPVGEADRPVPGDYNGDGATDLAVFRPSTDQWFIHFSSSGGQTIQFGDPRLDVPAPGNYDGTGKTEPAVYRPSTAQWFIFGPSGTRVVQFGAPGLDIPVPGDYDGDGKTDLAVYRPTTGQWFIHDSSGGGQSFQFGAPSLDIPVPGNYDGTGRVEPAVYRPTSAQWFIKGPNGGRAATFGAPNVDVPVPGDYDGDGRTDLAVFRPTTAQWFVRRSSAGNFSSQLGAAGLSVPVPGNYDGTGRSELAVYQPATAGWLIQGTSGNRSIQFGAAGSAAPVAPASLGSVVSLGGQTSRFAVSGGEDQASTAAQVVSVSANPPVIAPSIAPITPVGPATLQRLPISATSRRAAQRLALQAQLDLRHQHALRTHNVRPPHGLAGLRYLSKNA